ncbi:MAG: hypothetical protein KJS97_14245 [Alphaproteobacteria bacterium]|nr:hypothetical protein [Alphaproteobacteria bacterium]
MTPQNTGDHGGPNQGSGRIDGNKPADKKEAAPSQPMKTGAGQSGAPHKEGQQQQGRGQQGAGQGAQPARGAEAADPKRREHAGPEGDLHHPTKKSTPEHGGQQGDQDRR